MESTQRTRQLRKPVHVVVDGQQFFYGRRRWGHIDVLGFRRAVVDLYGPGRFDWCQASESDRTSFLDMLRRGGFQVTTRKPKGSGASLRADMDVDIAVFAMTDLAEYETLVLASGDGDFKSLLQAARRAGVRIVVAAFPDFLSPLLVEELDDPDTDLLDLTRFAAGTSTVDAA